MCETVSEWEREREKVISNFINVIIFTTAYTRSPIHNPKTLSFSKVLFLIESLMAKDHVSPLPNAIPNKVHLPNYEEMQRCARLGWERKTREREREQRHTEWDRDELTSENGDPYIMNFFYCIKWLDTIRKCIHHIPTGMYVCVLPPEWIERACISYPFRNPYAFSQNFI